MDRLPEFDDALDQMRCFLRNQGRPSNVLWAFREDWYSTGASCHRVIWPLPGDNEGFARTLYEAARRRGLVEVQAVFCAHGSSVCVVIAPDPDEIQGWNSGLKLAIREPFVSALTVTTPVRWRCHRIMPAYRRFQRFETSVPERKRIVRERLSNKPLQPTRAAQPNHQREASGGGPRG